MVDLVVYQNMVDLLGYQNMVDLMVYQNMVDLVVYQNVVDLVVPEYPARLAGWGHHTGQVDQRAGEEVNIRSSDDLGAGPWKTKKNLLVLYIKEQW